MRGMLVGALVALTACERADGGGDVLQVVAVEGSPPAMVSESSFMREMARERSSGVSSIEPGVRPDIAHDGRVAFVGRDRRGELALFVADDAGPVASIALSREGHERVMSIQIDDSGRLALLSDRRADDGRLLRGAYVVDPGATTTRTLVEAPAEAAFDAEVPPPAFNVALSPNGTLAYSTVLSSSGGIYRGRAAQTPAPLRRGSGIFYNTRRLDVNDAGTVAVQMEYTDPTRGLARGILLFDAQDQGLTEIDTAVEKLGIGTQPEPSLNARGDVAFFLNAADTMRFYEPRDDASGTPVEETTLEPGVYVARPKRFGSPCVMRRIADARGEYDRFLHVELGDDGTVVFEASLDGGQHGIYRGPDPAADKILATGDQLDDGQVTWLRLGEINDARQVVIVASSSVAPERRVWRSQLDR